jgi:hypothetical protein
MDLFKISTHKLQPLERTAFKLEREIQRLVEGNLGESIGPTARCGWRRWRGNAPPMFLPTCAARR